MTDIKRLRKQYASPKVTKLPFNKAKVFLQNQAAHGVVGAKDLLDLLATPPPKK
jgi:hypothetical protein